MGMPGNVLGIGASVGRRKTARDLPKIHERGASPD